MIDNQILNKMNVDELRNYAAHQNQKEELYESVVGQKNLMIRDLQGLYNDMGALNEFEMRMERLRAGVAQFEQEMNEKYGGAPDETM